MPTLSPGDSPLARSLIVTLSLLIAVTVMLIVYVLPTAAPPSAESLTSTQIVGSNAITPVPGRLATLNAALNGLSAVLLVAGYVCIRRRNIDWHKRFMSGAFAVSSCFLITYVLHHAQVGSVRFQGIGWVRVLYFCLLVPHIVLAAVLVPMALTTLYRAASGRLATHRRIARFTLPVWLYVSASGVVIYLMLYHL